MVAGFRPEAPMQYEKPRRWGRMIFKPASVRVKSRISMRQKGPAIHSTNVSA
jgi:hypothetical protein